MNTSNFDLKTVTVNPLSENVVVSPDEAVLPAGEYFLGDVSYTAGTVDSAWDKWISVAAAMSNDFMDGISGANYNSYPVVSVNTFYGDGNYESNIGVTFPVDGGNIGAVSSELVERIGLSREELENLGLWHTFTEDFKLTRSEDGLITIGHIEIPTGD